MPDKIDKEREIEIQCNMQLIDVDGKKIVIESFEPEKIELWV